MKIYAPVKDANGVWASVRFVNGVGETDNPKLIEWFKTHGYKVEVEDSPRVEQAATVQPIEVVEDVGNANQLDESEEVEEVVMMGYADKSPNFEEMTPNELREWAKANGFGNKIKNIRNKEKLIEILSGGE